MDGVPVCAVFVRGQKDPGDGEGSGNEQLERLTQALEEKEKVYRDRSDFFARISHDIRTPMNSILGIARLARAEDGARSLAHDMERISQTGEYILSLINDSLDLQRIDSGKLELNYQVVKAADFIMNVADIIQAFADEKGVSFSVVNKNIPQGQYFKIDPIRTKQIYVNLLNNAVKFTPPGGTVTWELECAGRSGDTAYLTVKIRDDGVGMSREYIAKHLYEPFSQESNGEYLKYTGTGLGLAIVKNLVDLVGGAIEVESEPDKGTTFTLNMAVEAVDEEEAGKKPDTKPASDRYRVMLLRGKKVLVCEDNPINAEITERLLDNIGCGTVWAEDGKKGLECFERSEPEEFFAILMDVRMPVMDGIEAARRIRLLSRGDAGKIPIIAMTGNACDEDRRQSAEAGMDAHLVKPLEPQLLYDTLCSFISCDKNK